MPCEDYDQIRQKYCPPGLLDLLKSRAANEITDTQPCVGPVAQENPTDLLVLLENRMLPMVLTFHPKPAPAEIHTSGMDMISPSKITLTLRK